MEITDELIVTTLHDAYEATDDAYYHATMHDASSDILQTLKDAKEHAFLAYIRGSKQKLIYVTTTTEVKVRELVETTAQLKEAIKMLKDASALVQIV